MTEGHRRLIGKLKSLLGDLGCHEQLIPHQLIRDQRIPLAGVAHQCGTVRFGIDPATSALDTDCKAHGVDNLYVGVPVIIGKDGVEQVIEIELNETAKAGLQVSIDAVKELLVACKGIDSSLA